LQDKEKAQLQLFELYHKDREMEEIKKEVRRQKQSAEQMEAERHVFDEGLKDAKKKLGETNREINKLDQQTRTAVGLSFSSVYRISILTMAFSGCESFSS
jgi:chromosome segregation ATPase